MPLQPTSGFFNDRHRVTASGRFDVEMKVKALFVADSPEEPHEGAVALSFNPNENDPPALNPTPPPHRVSAESRKPAKHARPVLRIETDVTSQALHVLGSVDARGPAVILLDDEEFFLLQIV